MAQSTTSASGVSTRRAGSVREANETRPASRTTEFMIWAAVVVSLIVAMVTVEHFGPNHGWLYVSIVTAAYIVSRGLAKSGVHHRGSDLRTDQDVR